MKQQQGKYPQLMMFTKLYWDYTGGLNQIYMAHPAVPG
jgi:hypothetical protein